MLSKKLLKEVKKMKIVKSVLIVGWLFLVCIFGILAGLEALFANQMLGVFILLLTLGAGVFLVTKVVADTDSFNKVQATE